MKKDKVEHIADCDAPMDELIRSIVEADRSRPKGPLIPGSDPEGLVRHVLELTGSELTEMQVPVYEALGLLRDIEGHLRAFLSPGGRDTTPGDPE